MKKLVALIFGLGLMVTANANVHEIKGQVMEIIDGNTLIVKSADESYYKVVLFGIDCPEMGQKYGDKAKKCLERLLKKQNVTVQFQGKDRAGNYLAIVTTDKNLDPRIQLLEEGLAWTSENEQVADLENFKSVAQQKGKGLWREKEPTPPWVFRRQQSMMQAKQS
ncbi:MAG TPA: thermonuclease family protein [Cyclobacteriaceae bacterium]|nr:thermonuclease family protein [Cyclobacteriaceae bacterium]